MFEPREYNARDRIGKAYIGSKSNIHNVHTVTFQPKGIATTQDRVVVDRWEICGQYYLFLGVFDGHSGSRAAHYASEMLPTLIRRKLRTFINSVGGKLDRDNIAQNEPKVTSLLKREVQKFDKSIGDALQQICPRPWELTEDEARRLIEEHSEVIERAFSGTTVALAIINLNERFMWAVGLGDSTVGLCVVDSDGNASGERLCELHTFKNPKEYFRATMAHPYAEQPIFDHEDRMLGWIAVARAVGDFALKLPATYTAHLFQYLPDLSGDPPLSAHVPRILTPPYIISEPSVRFTDLRPFWDTGSKVFLFTDGVDNLVNGQYVFTPRQQSGADPVDVVAGLLAEKIDPRIDSLLGHKTIPRWSGRENNRASDVLGNLLGGQDIERLEMVTDMARLQAKGDWPFHIDDTSIIVWPLSDG
ncbi:protein serine/threonine phosphatase 2C [Pilatotrama ljubarskyi]|nr:protein serine/threonine phosphatase 2C [Pilatotrama ljubarskyi]